MSQLRKALFCKLMTWPQSPKSSWADSKILARFLSKLQGQHLHSDIAPKPPHVTKGILSSAETHSAANFLSSRSQWPSGAQISNIEALITLIGDRQISCGPKMVKFRNARQIFGANSRAENVISLRYCSMTNQPTVFSVPLFIVNSRNDIRQRERLSQRGAQWSFACRHTRPFYSICAQRPYPIFYWYTQCVFYCPSGRVDCVR